MDQEQGSHAVTRLIDSWIAAEARGDTGFIDQVFADDFIAVGPLGFMLTKSEWIERHQTGKLKYDSLAMDDVTVRIYGETAIVIGRLLQDGRFQGNSIAGQLRTTVILVSLDGNWHLAGVHMSSIGQPPHLVQQESKG